MHHDEKYIVFKREEFTEWWKNINFQVDVVLPSDMPSLEDAVVIRTQDVFAHDGLSAYAGTVAAFGGGVAGMIADLPPEKRAAAQALVDRCTEIANYFHDCAVEAEDRALRGEGKVPD